MQAKGRSRSGQSLTEYAVILALIGVTVLAAAQVLGNNTSSLLALAAEQFGGASAKTSLGSEPLGIAQNFIQLIQAYHEQYGRWPRSWGSYRFADLGLDPGEWATPIDGIMYTPAGNRLGLVNARGDAYQMYVRTQDGQELHVYDGWGIWYNFADGKWYYHSVNSGIVVDVKSLRMVKED
ncbi:MAG: hypothetical protein J7M34_10265 [Anaerolineae bacterium]|nr:hypothetical protein [Anaerolineae bacterium]